MDMLTSYKNDGLCGRHLLIDWISETNKLDLLTLADRQFSSHSKRVTHLSFGRIKTFRPIGLPNHGRTSKVSILRPGISRHFENQTNCSISLRKAHTRIASMGSCPEY